MRNKMSTLKTLEEMLVQGFNSMITENHRGVNPLTRLMSGEPMSNRKRANLLKRAKGKNPKISKPPNPNPQNRSKKPQPSTDD